MEICQSNCMPGWSSFLSANSNSSYTQLKHSIRQIVCWTGMKFYRAEIFFIFRIPRFSFSLFVAVFVVFTWSRITPRTGCLFVPPRKRQSIAEVRKTEQTFESCEYNIFMLAWVLSLPCVFMLSILNQLSYTLSRCRGAVR